MASTIKRFNTAPDPLAQSALLLIDIQQGYHHPTHWGASRSNPDFEKNITTLLTAFRTAQPKNPNVFHVRHHSPQPSSPLHPSKPGAKFMSIATPDPNEPIYTKTVSSPFIENNLKGDLRNRRIKTLYVCGLCIEGDVGTAVRMAKDLQVVSYEGGKIVLIADATAAFNRGAFGAETVMGVAVESLRGEFCEVQQTGDVMKLVGWI